MEESMKSLPTQAMANSTSTFIKKKDRKSYPYKSLIVKIMNRGSLKNLFSYIVLRFLKCAYIMEL